MEKRTWPMDLGPRIEGKETLMKLGGSIHAGVRLFAIAVVMAVGIQPVCALNLIYNSTCDGAIGLGQGELSPYDGLDAGWRLQNLSGSYMFSSPPAGKLSLHSGGTDPNTRYSQVIKVKAGATYTASVSVGLSGGTGSLEVQEFDASDNPVGAPHSVALPSPQAGNSGYTVVTYDTIALPAFTTDASASYVEYRLNWQVDGGAFACRWDDAVLDGPPVDTATLQGTVKAPDGTPVSGATVAAGSLSSVTDGSGAFALSGLPVTGGPLGVTCTNDGFLSEGASPMIVPGENTLDFELIAVPTSNLLANSSFEAGIGPGFNSANPDIQVDAVKEWAISGSSSSYWYINPNNVAHTGTLSNGPYCYESFDISQYQDIPVRANTLYKACVWLQPINLSNSGAGFGSDPSDSAGLWIQELDASGAVVVDHGELKESTPQLNYVHKYKEFTTGADTAKVRFRLHSKLTNQMPAFNRAKFRYDTAVLDGPPAPSFIGDVLSKPDGSTVALQGKVVSAAFLDFQNFEDYFYIQEPDRSSGIKVKVGTPTPGNLVNVEGTIETINGERTIVASSIQEGSSVGVPTPLTTLNRNAATSTQGLHMTGLFITAFGKVDATGGSTFTIDDGSGAPLKVLAPEGFSATPGSFISVTGPLGAEVSGDGAAAVLRGVSASD